MSAISKQRWLWGLIFFLLIGLGGYAFSFWEDYNKVSSEIILLPVEVLVSEPNIKLAFVGDIMLDRGVKNSVYKNFNGDYGELFSKVVEQLQGHDFLFGNLEGPVSDKGFDTGSLYSFRMEPVVLSALKNAGFSGFSIDNNHILNYGPEALADTKARLAENDFLVGGQSFDLSGMKIIILTYDQFANLDLEEMKQEISLAKLNNDLVFTYYHFGDEYETEPNDYQRNVAKMAVEAGADLVLGAHPHVVQTLEQYKNVYIMYSLGNFVFDQYFSRETMEGGLLEVEINPNTKRIEKVNLKKVQLNKFFQLEGIK